MLNKLMSIILISIFLSGCNSSYDVSEIKDVMNFDHGEIRFTQRPRNQAEIVVTNELIDKFGINESAFQDINVIDIKSYFTIEDLKADELDTYKIAEVEEIFSQEQDPIIVYLLYDYKLSTVSKIDTLDNFNEGLIGEYFILPKVGNDYEIVYGNFKNYTPMVIE